MGDTGETDFWVIKLNADGEIQWENTIGGSLEDRLDAIVSTPDGGFLLGGTSQSQPGFDKTATNYGGDDYWIVKINASGQVVWDKTYGSESSDVIRSLVPTSDGGYLAGGTSLRPIGRGAQDKALLGSNYWVVKLDSSGNMEWEKLMGGSVDDFGRSVAESNQGGYIMAGWSASGISGDKTIEGYDNPDYWVVELDATGEIVGQNLFGTPESDDLQVFIRTPDMKYVLGGFTQASVSGDKTEPSNGGSDFWILELNGLY